jgi:hypothetical protein
MSSILCRQCNQPITFYNKHISQRTGKKIPLDPNTNEPHDCPARREEQQAQLPTQSQQPRRYLQCNKGCGQEIYFDSNSKSQSGKFELKDKIKYNYHYAYDVISVFIPFS